MPSNQLTYDDLLQKLTRDTSQGGANTPLDMFLDLRCSDNRNIACLCDPRVWAVIDAARNRGTEWVAMVMRLSCPPCGAQVAPTPLLPATPTVAAIPASAPVTPPIPTCSPALPSAGSMKPGSKPVSA